MKTLLAIDGGGLFGIGVANWIPKLENFVFDYYAGTSVGSILAACYVVGMESKDVQEKFNGELPWRIFTKPRSINPLRPAVYDDKGAKEVLKEIFGDIRVGDTKYPLVIVAISNHRHNRFRQCCLYFLRGWAFVG